MDIKELGPIGAELTNLDLTQLSKEDIPHIRQSFLDYSVIVFRNQNLNPIDLKNISGVSIASVVPEVLLNIKLMLKTYLNVKGRKTTM